MSLLRRRDRFPESAVAPFAPYTNADRLLAINASLDINPGLAPEYLESKSLDSRFALLDERASQYISLSTTEHDPRFDLFRLPKTFICQIRTKSDKTENIRLSIEFGREHQRLEYLDLLWFADSADKDGFDENTFNSSHALDPLRIIREDYLEVQKKSKAVRAQLRRELNYTARTMEIYEQAFSAEHNEVGYEGKTRPKRTTDTIDLAVAGLISNLAQ